MTHSLDKKLYFFGTHFSYSLHITIINNMPMYFHEEDLSNMQLVLSGYEDIKIYLFVYKLSNPSLCSLYSSPAHSRKTKLEAKIRFKENDSCSSKQYLETGMYMYYEAMICSWALTLTRQNRCTTGQLWADAGGLGPNLSKTDRGPHICFDDHHLIGYHRV